METHESVKRPKNPYGRLALYNCTSFITSAYFKDLINGFTNNIKCFIAQYYTNFTSRHLHLTYLRVQTIGSHTDSRAVCRHDDIW